MNLIDTHTHLYVEEFDQDLDEVVQRAISNGVEYFILPAIDSTYTDRMYALEKKYPKYMKLMTGLHPCSVKSNYQSELEFIKRELESRKFWAIGEIGIDLYWDKSTLEIQQIALQTQIKLAKKYKLPINIHCRDGYKELFEVLELEKDEKLFGILHCFSGTEQDAEKAISYNLKLGIGGVVSFKNGKIDKFLNKFPIENIVLETDSPYLAPIPYRGKRNESSYLVNIVAKLSEIYGITAAEVATQTTENASRVFGLK